MKKKSKKTLMVVVVLLLTLFPHIMNFFVFILLNGFSILTNYKVTDYLLKFFQIILNNQTYYATCVSMIWAITVYFKQQKTRQSELDEERRNREMENNKIRLKELEKFKNSFRPNFVLNSDGNKLMLLMKKEDLCIENVYFYSSETAVGKYYHNLIHKSEIDLEGCTNNYFVTAETLIGEKIIFGVVLNTVKVYKLLKDGCSPIIPSIFTGENTWQKINENWLSFNRNELDENLEAGIYRDDFKEIDKNFMYKTVAIREKMALNLTEHMIRIIRKDTVKDLIFEVLESISSNKKEYSDCMRKKVIDELQNILQENLNMITINPRNISDDIWKYINGKVNVANRFTSDQDIAVLYIIKQYLTSVQEDMDNFISVFFALIKHADFSEQLENKTEQYKVRMLKCIEN